MWPRRALLALAAALATGCGGDGLDRLADGGRAEAVEALSGEVLRLDDGRTVRLAGIEAPGGSEAFAAEAREALGALAGGRTVSLLHGGERIDAYGRPFAHVRVHHRRRWVQGALLDAGLVRVRTTPGEAALAAEMLRREAQARARRRGLWADPSYRVRLPGEVEPDAPGFLIVEGRVRRLERVGGRVFLDFGADRRGFSVETPRRALADLEAAGVGVDSLPGGLVRVRGTVRPSRFGPVMRVDHPEQIERLRERN